MKTSKVVYSTISALLTIACVYGAFKVQDLPKPEIPNWLTAFIVVVLCYGAMAGRMLLYSRSREESIDSLLWPRELVRSLRKSYREGREEAR
jgi:hypothetical protein